jgi:hypothetical protein
MISVILNLTGTQYLKVVNSIQVLEVVHRVNLHTGPGVLRFWKLYLHLLFIVP